MDNVPEEVTASAALIVMLRFADAVWLAESVAVTVKSNVPVVVAEPEIVPDVLKLSPGGKVPAAEVTAHVYGAVPPVAVRAVDG